MFEAPYGTLCSLFLLLSTLPSMAQNDNETAQWQIEKDKTKLRIYLEKHLSKKQIKLIKSGFSTYTSLEIFLPRGQFTERKSLYRSECTVKYDTWEEYYDISIQGYTKGIEKAKSFEKFSEFCLVAHLEKDSSLNYFYRNGGVLYATLKLDQISKDRATNIRKWLIKQQSGVIKGLFAHMLGDLNLTEELNVNIKIPPFSKNAGLDPEWETEIMAIYPRNPIEIR